MAASEQPLSIREKLAYGLGDSAANLIGATQTTFLLYFYTDVFGITAQAAGAILLVSRLIDAFNDPLVGALADRTNSRWGRYRPWVLWSAAPLAASLVLCYTTPNVGATGKVAWAIITYNLMMILYAMNNIPYCALSGVMTGDGNERTKLASWRFLCAMAAALVVNMFTLNMVQWLGRGSSTAGFQLTMVVWGVVAILCFVATFMGTRERLRPVESKPSTVSQDIADLFRNNPWKSLFILSVLICIQLALRSGGMLYYFQHYQQAPRLVQWVDNFGLFNGIGLLFTMIGVFLSNPLARRFGKRNTFQVCLLFSGASMAAFGLLPRDAIWGLFVLQILLQLAFGPTIPLLWAMMADVADYSEWQTGRRSTALAFASIVFGLKLGFGIGGWLSGELLHRAGYSPQQVVGEPARRVIAMLISVFPAAALLLGFVVLFFYGIDQRRESEIETTLRARRAEGMG